MKQRDKRTGKQTEGDENITEKNLAYGVVESSISEERNEESHDKNVSIIYELVN